MWNRISRYNRKCIGFFIYIERHSKYFYKYALSAEYLLFKKFKLDPLAFESRYTVFDYKFFIDRIVDEIIEENKDNEKNGGDKLIKVLKVMKSMLNKIEI